MRRPLTSPKPGGRVQSAVWPAPIKGLKTDEGLTKEQPGAALRLRNMVPETDAVRVRGGFQQWAFDLNADPVESLMVYTSGSTSKMFAAAEDEIWDVTSTGDVGASAAVGSLTDAYRSWVNFTASSGTHYLVTVNGANDGKLFDGSNWTTTSITGVTDNDLIYVWSFKTRLWFIEKTSMKAWYMPVGAITGAATSFALGPIFKRGGRLIAGGTWSVDSATGTGMDDMIVFVSSEGEVAVYEMSDPDDPTSILLKGVYFVGRPLGQRCLANYGGDLLILTYQGLIPLSKAVSIDSGTQDFQAVTSPVRKDFGKDALTYGANEGWQVLIYPAANLGIINVPVTVEGEYKQYVWNLLTGAFATWEGHPSLCWAVFGEDLYFGGISEVVYKADNGSADDSAPIEAEVVTSYSQMGHPARVKHIMQVRPIIDSTQELVGGVRILANYEDPSTIPATLASEDFSGFTWHVSDWGEDNWAGAEILRGWQSGNNYGNAIAIHFGVTITSDSPTSDLTYRLIGFDVLFQTGGVLGG